MVIIVFLYFCGKTYLMELDFHFYLLNIKTNHKAIKGASIPHAEDSSGIYAWMSYESFIGAVTWSSPYIA